MGKGAPFPWPRFSFSSVFRGLSLPLSLCPYQLSIGADMRFCRLSLFVQRLHKRRQVADNVARGEELGRSPLFVDEWKVAEVADHHAL
jgi:hypothetical protein